MAHPETSAPSPPDVLVERGIGSLERGIDVLFHLQRAGRPMGVSELGRGLGWPKSSVHRLLSALHRRSLVEKDPSGRYRPGFALVALGLGALASEPLVAAARPVLEASAERWAETFFVVSDRAGRLVVLDKAEGRGFLRAAPRVGASVPVHATAVGALYTAFAPERLAPPESPPERFTRRTAVSEEERARAVARARDRGWAQNREEWVPGLSVVAAPVFASGALCGAVAMAAAAPRMDEIGDESASRAVIEAAARIAARLEGRSS